MPWCEDCAKYWTPSAMNDDGTCPSCGRSVAASAPLTLVAGAFLIGLGNSNPVRIATAVYVLSALNLFSVSATYHIGRWSLRVKQALRRYDHSNIFLIIAGTYTPLAVALLPSDDARTLLIGIWTAALAGVGLSTIWINRL